MRGRSGHLDDRDLWNQRYAARQRPHDGPPSPCLRRWLPLLPRGWALDVATGLGRNAILMAKAGFRVVAVDFSRTGLEIARRRARQARVRVRWVEADLETWPIPRSKYAVVVDTFYTNRKRLADLKASVKPGGVFLVETHVRATGGSAKQRGHHFGVRRGELRRWFRDWEILELEEGYLTERGAEKEISRIVARRPR